MLSQCAYSYGVKIIKLAWVGTRTENFEPTVDFFRDVRASDRNSIFLGSVCWKLLGVPVGLWERHVVAAPLQHLRAQLGSRSALTSTSAVCCYPR